MATIVQQTNGEKTIYTADEYTSVLQKFNDVNAQLADIAKDISLKSDGTDSTPVFNSFINSLGTNKATIIIPSGTYDISTNLTIPSNVDLFFRGGLLRINSGATLTVNGNIIAGNRELFIDNGGSVCFDQSPNEYNLGWFKTTNGYINERWNFAKRGMSSYRKRSIRVPRPYNGQQGTLNSGGRLFWLFSDEITIGNNQDTSIWYIDGEFKANNNCNNFINFYDTTNKPENIYFYGDINVLVDPGVVVGTGINIQSGTRITFWGNVIINGCQTGVKIGSSTHVWAVTDIVFFKIQCSYFYQSALWIYGNSAYITEFINVYELDATAAQMAGLNVVEIRGALRDVRIGDVVYTTDVARSGYTANDASNVVYMESNDEGTMNHIRIGAIYQANASNGLKTMNTSATLTANNLIDVKVTHIYGAYNGNAAILDYCYALTIENIENNSKVTVNSTCYYVNIKTGSRMASITDNGNYTLVNGLGKQSRGAGVAPAPTLSWPIGSHIRETADGKVYLRITNTGTSTDFVALN